MITVLNKFRCERTQTIVISVILILNLMLCLKKESIAHSMVRLVLTHRSKMTAKCVWAIFIG